MIWTWNCKTEPACSPSWPFPPRQRICKKLITFRAPAIYPNFTKYCACHENWHCNITKYWAVARRAYQNCYLTELSLAWMGCYFTELLLGCCLTELLLYWTVTERLLYWTVPLLNGYFTDLLLDWTVTLLNCYFTELLLYWTVTLLSCYFTELFLYGAVTLLNCYFTELLLYWAATWVSWYFAEFFVSLNFPQFGSFSPKLPLIRITVHHFYLHSLARSANLCDVARERARA